MSSSILDSVPAEYKRIFAELPDHELSSFQHSLSINQNETNKYLQLHGAVKKNLEIYTDHSKYWTYLYGRIASIASLYSELLSFWEKPQYNETKELAPFVARVLSFQNKYEEAIEVAKKALEEIDIETDLDLLTILLYFETNFSLGLAFAYTRQFESAEKIINDLETFSSKYIVKKTLGEEQFLDYVYYEHILKAYVAFFKGQPKEMSEALDTIHSWVEKLIDPWLKGFYFNIYGIAKSMFQELEKGEIAFKKAYEEFDTVHDLRGYSAVGANLGMSLIGRGKRLEGREYLESVIQPQLEMKNHWLAVGNMLTVAKSYLDEKKEEKAMKMVNKAEEVSEELNTDDPAIFSNFAYFYSRIGDLNKASSYIERLREMTKVDEDEEELDDEDIDYYTKMFYYNAAAVNSMAKGDLNLANTQISRGIEIADETGYFNYSLELSFIHIEIIFKRYLVDQKQEHLLKGLEILKDLAPLIEMAQHPFLETLFYLINAYVFLVLNNHSESQEHFDKAASIAMEFEESAQYKEISLFEERYNFIKRSSSPAEEQTPLFNEFVNTWLSDEFLQIFYVVEAMRLLTNLQFEKTNLGQQTGEDKLPLMIFILSIGGQTIYTHRFEGATGEIDEVLVGGFLSALTSFSQELFGGGMLSRVDQENHVLLLERISDNNILVLLVDEETYLLRKKFKKFSAELSRMKVVDYLDSDVVLTEYDPQYSILEGLVEIIFLGDGYDES